MTEQLTFAHERVDDIPLILGLIDQLGLPESLDRHLGNHGHHRGLSTGWVASVWLAFILSAGDHRKSTVQSWVDQRQQTLERLLGQPLRRGLELNDDRLGIVLRRLSQDAAWAALDAELWEQSVQVYDVEAGSIRVDSTTSYGYHRTTDGGLMQRGHSKDHRPDLPQLKLMAAAAEPSGLVVASDLHPGNAADDRLYTPLIARVRASLARTGLLYIGDSKMAAQATRADLVAHGDHYLMPLPQVAESAAQRAAWIEAAVAQAQPLDEHPPTDGDPDETTDTPACGLEVQRPQTVLLPGRVVTWTERVLVVRSPTLARRQAEHLTRQVVKAEAALWTLTPPPGRGRRQYRDAAPLTTAITAVLARFDVADVLEIAITRDPDRPARHVIRAVRRLDAALAVRQARLGWRILVTNLPADQVTLSQAVTHYRLGWRIERAFHLVKDRPLGLSPLFVRRDDQIVGLTRLLLLALRLLTILETQLRRALATTAQALTGLYPGQPRRATARPTAVSVLHAVARAEITLTRLVSAHGQLWHLTPLPPLLTQILRALGLSPALYQRLTVDSSSLPNSPPVLRER